MNRLLELLIYPFFCYLLFASISPVSCPAVLTNYTYISTAPIYKYDITYCNSNTAYIYSYESPLHGVPFSVQEWMKQNPTMSFHRTIFGRIDITKSYFIRSLIVMFMIIACSAHCCALLYILDIQKNI